MAKDLCDICGCDAEAEQAYYTWRGTTQLPSNLKDADGKPHDHAGKWACDKCWNKLEHLHHEGTL